MKFPVEIIENILIYCDGKTLKNARLVSEEWKQIVRYLSKKGPLWENCCKNEIPEKELIDYLNKYDSTDKKKWKYVYENWLSWQEIERIKYDIIFSPVEVPRISCLSVAGRFIAVGSEDGRVRIYSDMWRLLYVVRHKAVKVTKITFIKHGTGPDIRNMSFVIAFPRALVIDDINPNKTNDDCIIMEDIRDHSVFENYICFEKVRGLISIDKLVIKDGKKILEEVWFSRIYSPSYPQGLSIWNGLCNIIINNQIKFIRYDSENIPNISHPKKRATLKSVLHNNEADEERNYQLFTNDVIISLCKAKNFSQNQFIELFILGPNHKCSTKLSNTWEALHSFVTCVFLYGRILVLGVNYGAVYFYHVPTWKEFNISNYQRKIIIGKHPILSIDLSETKNERKFYIASNFCIHEIVFFDPRCYNF